MKKLLLIPITLTALTPTISMVGCNNPEPKDYLAINGLRQSYEGIQYTEGNTNKITVEGHEDGNTIDVTDLVTFDIEGPLIGDPVNKGFKGENTIPGKDGGYDCSITANYLDNIVVSDTYQVNLFINTSQKTLFCDGLTNGQEITESPGSGEISPIKFGLYDPTTRQKVDVSKEVSVLIASGEPEGDFLKGDSENGRIYGDDMKSGSYAYLMIATYQTLDSEIYSSVYFKIICS